MFFWLPASYHTPPAAVGALLAGLLTKVGVYAMIRVFTLLFPDPAASVYAAMLVLSAVTMVGRLVGALGQHDLAACPLVQSGRSHRLHHRRSGVVDAAALGGSILYVLHHMLVISTLFLVSGLFLRQRRTTDLRSLGGLYRSQPFVACLAMIPLFSLAGVPPLSGFIAKLAVVGPMIDRQQYVLAAIALAVSLLTVLSMARVWEEAFWKPAPDHASRRRSPAASWCGDSRAGGVTGESDVGLTRGRGSRVRRGDARCAAVAGPRRVRSCGARRGGAACCSVTCCLRWRGLHSRASFRSRRW